MGWTIGGVDAADAYAYPESAPWLRANMVASLDGAAQLEGRSGGLGNDTDRRLFQLLRGLADVVIVGAGTVRAERYGPVRPSPDWAAPAGPDGSDGSDGSDGPARRSVPPLAVLSGSLALDPDAVLFTEGPTIVITCAAAPAERRHVLAERAEVIVAGSDRVDLHLAMAELARRGLNRMVCEGGPRLLAQVVAAGLLDELCLTLSPRLLLGDAARIVNGPRLSVPEPFRLAHVLRDAEDFLFLRYTRTTAR